MEELNGYLSPASEREVGSPMADSSDDDMPVNKNMSKHNSSQTAAGANAVPAATLKRFDFIPMRLTEKERKMLEVLENALEVCEYTDVVDVTFSHTKKSKLSRILESLVDMLSISCGLLVSVSLKWECFQCPHFVTLLLLAL